MDSRGRVTIGDCVHGTLDLIAVALSPLMLLSYLPEEVQIRYRRRVWDKRTDREILNSFYDAAEWIRWSYGDCMNCDTTDKLAQTSIMRLHDHIWPQIEKRNIQGRIS